MKKLASVTLILVFLLGFVVSSASADVCVPHGQGISFGVCYADNDWKTPAQTMVNTLGGAAFGLVGGPVGVVIGAEAGWVLKTAEQIIDGKARPSLCLWGVCL